MNYRLISLLSNISKVYKTIINNYIVAFCGGDYYYDIISECQFGV